MKKIFIIFFCFLFLTFKSYASVHCFEGSFGNRNCYGTDSNGKHVSTTSYTDSFGTTMTYGTIGDSSVSTTSYSDDFGTTMTYGTIGDSSVSTTSYSDDFGTTMTYGTIGDSNVSTTSYSDGFGNTDFY